MEWKTFGLIMATAVISSAIGTYIGITHTETDPVEVDTVELQNNPLDTGVVYNVSDFEVVVLPSDHKEMEGRLGFFRQSQPNRIYLRYQDPEDFYNTCVHEEMHLKGVRAEQHDYIGEVEDSIVSENCLEAVEKLGQYKPVEERNLFGE